MTALARPSVATLRAAETAWIAGRAALVGADLIISAVAWRLTENCMPHGTVVLEVWGGEVVDAWRTIEAHRPVDVGVVLVHRPASAWHRVLRWCLSRYWRWVLGPMRLRGTR